MAKAKTFPRYEIAVKDESATNPLVEDLLPLHRPNFFGLAEKGEFNKPFYGSYAELIKKFGAITFDERSKYFMHSNLFAKECAKYNKIFFTRINPVKVVDGVADPTTEEIGQMILFCIIEPQALPKFARVNSVRTVDEDGNWVIVTGDPDPTFPGFIVKWAWVPVGATSEFDYKTCQIQTIVDGLDTITAYPILGFKMKSAGQYAKNVGIKMFLDSAPDFDLMDAIDSMAYSFGMVEIPSSASTPVGINSRYLEKIVTIALKENVVDPRVNKLMSFDDILLNDYKEDDIPFEYHAYYDNVETIQNAVYAAIENDNPDFTDHLSLLNKAYMIDILEGKIVVDNDTIHYNDYLLVESSLPYVPVGAPIIAKFDNLEQDSVFTWIDTDYFEFVDGTGFAWIDATGNKSFVTHEALINYFVNGSDGSVYDIKADIVPAFEEGVKAWLGGSVFPEIQDQAKYPITHFYDSGYSMPAKLAHMPFAAIRDDVKFVMSTQDASMNPNTKAQDIAAGSSIRAAALLQPESFIHGTQACRFTIFYNCGKLTNNLLWNKFVPATIDAMIKKAYWHGATYIKGEPKGLPLSAVTILKDINWFPVTDDLKQSSWDNGCNYMQYYSMTEVFYPDTRTVYGNDTSLLSGDIFVDYLIYLKHIVRTEWAVYAGVTYSITKLIGNIRRTLGEKIYKALQNYIRVEVNPYQTDIDKEIGYQLSIEIAVYDTPANRVWKVVIPVRREEE